MAETPGLRVLLVGSWGPGALERAYEEAFREAGCETRRFDLPSSEAGFVRLGRAGRLFHTFVPVEAWVRKANRELFLTARAWAPELLVGFGQNPVLAGALAQTLVATKTRSLLVWQDTLVNLDGERIDALPLYDLVASYSRDTVPMLERLGARRTAWVPLAGKPASPVAGPPPTTFSADVSFIGQWRPERDEALSVLLRSRPALDVKIWGSGWGRRGSALVRRAWQGRPLFDEEFAAATAASRVNLNVIDETNFPAPNNRFFEIPCLGGLQLSSPCPEMEDEFREGVEIAYYRDSAQLPGVVDCLLADETRRRAIAEAGAVRARERHTWTHRVKQLLALLGLEGDEAAAVGRFGRPVG